MTICHHSECVCIATINAHWHGWIDAKKTAIKVAIVRALEHHGTTLFDFLGKSLVQRGQHLSATGKRSG